MTYTPRALTQHLSIQAVGSELLVYDELRHLAFCLNRTSAAVFTLADGTRGVAELAAAATLRLEAPVSEDVVRFALSELVRDGLIEKASDSTVATSVSRRELVRKLGAGAVMMVPVVAMVMAPAAAQAYSGCFNCSAVQNSRRQPASVRQFAVANPTFTNSTSGCHSGIEVATQIGTGCQVPTTTTGATSNSNTNSTPNNPFIQ